MKLATNIINGPRPTGTLSNLFQRVIHFNKNKIHHPLKMSTPAIQGKPIIIESCIPELQKIPDNEYIMYHPQQDTQESKAEGQNEPINLPRHGISFPTRFPRPQVSLLHSGTTFRGMAGYYAGQSVLNAANRFGIHNPTRSSRREEANYNFSEPVPPERARLSQSCPNTCIISRGVRDRSVILFIVSRLVISNEPIECCSRAFISKFIYKESLIVSSQARLTELENRSSPRDNEFLKRLI